MTDVIDLSKGDSYQIFENYLHDLYFAQVDDNGNCNYCMDDLLVVWDLVYDYKGPEYLNEVIERQGKNNFPTLFEHDSSDDDRWSTHRIFFSYNDWCEGERWAVVHAVFSLSEMCYDPDIDGFKRKSMKLLNRDDREEEE